MFESRKRFSAYILAAILCGLAGVAPLSAEAADKYITVGTAGVTGVYYPAGGAVCRLVNRGRKEHGIRCSVESTNGSVSNLNGLRTGDLDIAAAQSDWQYHATKGTGPFAEVGADTNLRSMFSLHSEPFTLVVRADSGIKKLDDLVGKRVNIGNQGSGVRATMEVVMDLKGWTKETFSESVELRASEQAQALCDGKIDVMVYAAGHPNGAVQEVTTTCDARLINVAGPEIDKLISKHPYYAYTTIPGGMYAGNPEDIKTFGVKATFVTSAKVDEKIIYEVVRAVFENFEDFKTLHPVFSGLDSSRLIKEGNIAPLHKGAEKYFREKGMIKQ